jgi:hypothetical protein
MLLLLLLSRHPSLLEPLLDELRAADKATDFYPLPACQAYLRDRTGYITSREIRTLRTELPEYELRAYLQKRNDWSNDVYDSISRPAYGSASVGLTGSMRTCVVKFSHGWLPIGVRERRCSATNDLCPQCNEIETVPHLYRCQAREPWRHWFLIHLLGHLKETKTAADIRCKIIKGIEHLIALKQSPKSAGFKYSKDTSQTSGL